MIHPERILVLQGGEEVRMRELYEAIDNWIKPN